MTNISTPIRSRFFGHSHADICAIIARANQVVQSLGSTTPSGVAVIRLQEVAQDLANYAELLRQHEAAIMSSLDQSIAKKEEAQAARAARAPRSRNFKSTDRRRNA